MYLPRYTRSVTQCTGPGQHLPSRQKERLPIAALTRRSVAGCRPLLTPQLPVHLPQLLRVGALAAVEAVTSGADEGVGT
jgi:hypothetical protein